MGKVLRLDDTYPYDAPSFDFGSNQSEIWIEGDIAVDADGLADLQGASFPEEDFIQVSSFSGSDYVGMGWYVVATVPEWIAYNNPNDPALTVGSPSVAANTWYHVKMHVIAGTPPTQKMWVNGTDLGTVNVSGAHQANMRTLYLYKLGNGITPSYLYWDNITVGSTEGASDIFSDDFEGGDLSNWTTQGTNCDVIDDPGIGGGGPVEYDETGKAISVFTGGGSLHGGLPPGVSWQWQRGDGETWWDIGGAYGLNYVVVAEDYGYQLRVVEIDTNYIATAEAPSEATDFVYADKTGAGQTILTGGGSEFRVGFLQNETGAAFSTRAGGGGKGGSTFNRTGVGISERVGKGREGGKINGATWKYGRAVIDNFSVKGGDATTWAKTGKTFSALTGGGFRARDLAAKTGTAVSARIVSGTDSFVHLMTKTGKGISPRVAKGKEKHGVATKALLANGAANHAYVTKSGLADIDSFWVTFKALFPQQTVDYLATDELIQIMTLNGYIGDLAIWVGMPRTYGGWIQTDFTQSAFVSNLTADTWHLFEMHYVGGTSSPITFALYYDSTLLYTINGENMTEFTALNLGITAFQIGDQRHAFDGSNPGNPAIRVEYDNLTLGTTRGGTGIFSDNFESGNLSAWSSTHGSVSVVSEIA